MAPRGGAMRPALTCCLLLLAATQTTLTRGESLFRFDQILLTGQPAPGLGPALVDEIGVYVDIFNPDPFAGGPQIGPDDGIGVGGQAGGDGVPSTFDGSRNAI